MTLRLVLASASETRLRVLRQAGFDPEVVVSGVDERSEAPVETAVGILAERKAIAVAAASPDALVLGCDSLVDFDGRVLGKPGSDEEAASWWRAMRGNEVTVWTGQCLIHGERRSSRTRSATLRFGTPTDAEIERFVASGEATAAAGGFRVHGRSSAFIETITGHPSTVSGVSMPALREMLADLSVEVTDLWV